MKKVLLASAALLVAGMVSANAAPVKLSVGGYANWYTGYVDGNSTYNENMTSTSGIKTYNHVPVIGDVEVAFKGETVLANGVKFGAVIELTGTSGAENPIKEDQSYVYANTSFGRFVLGKMDSISKQYHKTAKDVGQFSIQSSDYEMLVPGTCKGLNTDIRINDDFGTIAYMSPKYAGFSFAASYSDASSGDVTQNDNGDDSMYVAAVAYDNTFGGLRVQADVSYGNRESNAWEYAIVAGTRLSYSGFTFGAGYKYIDYDSNKIAYSSSNTFDVGVAYETGPYGVSVAYIFEDNDGANVYGYDMKRSLLLASFNYNVTDGVNLFSTLGYSEKKQENEKENTYLVSAGLGIAF